MPFFMSDVAHIMVVGETNDKASVVGRSCTRAYHERVAANIFAPAAYASQVKLAEHECKLSRLQQEDDPKTRVISLARNESSP
jgi:hypothetical protein